MSEPDQGAAAAAAAVARPAPASLFIVERRLPKASEHHLALLQAGGAERRCSPVQRPPTAGIELPFASAVVPWKGTAKHRCRPAALEHLARAV